MSKSAPITISSAALRERVEDHLDRMIPDHTWERSELYARRKLDYYRGHYPDVDYFDNESLVLLTADTVNETEFSDYTMADCAAKMAARASD